MTIIDANVLIYACNVAAPRHRPARKWLESAFSSAEPIRLAWATIHAFLRIVTHPRILPRPFSNQSALSLVEEWLAQPSVAPIEPGTRYWSIFREVVRIGQVRGDLMMDAHLAALAIENGAVLCTTDKDFTRFEGLRLLNPLA